MDLPWLSSDETVTAWSRMSEERVEGVALCIQAARLESREKGNASMANAVQQSGDGAKKGKLAVLFEDLSIAQVIAGALAAATVFLLSSVIGVAGSLIGAAVGSIVSAVSSQVYKKMLSASADKIRDVAPDGASANQADPNETRLMEPVSSSETRVIDSDKIAVSATKVMGAHASSDKAVDPALQRAHVRRRRKARVQRSVIIVSIVSALIAIVVSAGLIHVFTDGQGIGEKTEPIFTASEASQAKQGSSASNGATKETAANESTSSKSNEGSSQSGKSSSADSSNSSTSASGSGSGSGSSDSSASSNGGSSSSDSSSENVGSSSKPGSGSSGSGNSGSSSENGSSGSGSSSGSSGSGSPSAGSGN